MIYLVKIKLQNFDLHLVQFSSHKGYQQETLWPYDISINTYNNVIHTKLFLMV